MIAAVKDRGPKVRPWLDQFFVPMNVVLAVLVSVTSLFFDAGTVARGAAARGHAGAPQLLHLAQFKREGVVKALAKLRAPLGISSSMWFVAHAVVSLKLFDLAAPLSPQFAAEDIILGAFALTVFVALLATSNTASQRRLGTKWKRLQRLVWFAVPLAAVHAFLSSQRFLKETESLGTFLLVMLAGFVAFEWISQRRAGGASHSKVVAHLRLSFAGVVVAALLALVLPARVSNTELTDRNWSGSTSSTMQLG